MFYVSLSSLVHYYSVIDGSKDSSGRVELSCFCVIYEVVWRKFVVGFERDLKKEKARISSGIDFGARGNKFVFWNCAKIHKI